jgi:hypothetical protein
MDQDGHQQLRRFEARWVESASHEHFDRVVNNDSSTQGLIMDVLEQVFDTSFATAIFYNMRNLAEFFQMPIRVRETSEI